MGGGYGIQQQVGDYGDARMSKYKKDMDGAEDSSTYRKARRGIDGKCSRCPPHDGENRSRRVKPTKYKSKRKGKA